MTTTVTYEQAAEIVYEASVATWDPSYGTLIIDDRVIIEDDDVYVFIVGARENLIDMNPEYLTAGDSNAVVDKTDGTLMWIPWHFIQDERPDLVERQNPNPVYFH